MAPVDQDFRSWATDHGDARTAGLLSALAGVYTFHHDPGELSAALVWERSRNGCCSARDRQRASSSAGLGHARRRARAPRALARGGDRHRRARERPPRRPGDRRARTARCAPRSSATTRRSIGPAAARSASTSRSRNAAAHPWVVSDLESSGWIERYSARDASLAPAGEQLVQAQMPIRPDESADDAGRRLERLLDASFEAWSDRVTSRPPPGDGRPRGALDLPGTDLARPTGDRPRRWCLPLRRPGRRA